MEKKTHGQNIRRCKRDEVMKFAEEYRKFISDCKQKENVQQISMQ